MKKATWFLALLLIFSCLYIPVHAQEALPADTWYEVTLSEDYRSVIWNGMEYQRFDSAGVILEVEEAPWDAALTLQQQQTIRRISVTLYNAQTVIGLQIHFPDSTALSAYYLRTDLMAEYTDIVSGKKDDCQIDFLWPEGNLVAASRSQLTGAGKTLTADILEWCDSFDVSFCSSDGKLKIATGAVIHYEGQYFYVDFSENGIVYNEYGFYPYDYTSLSGREITDSALLEALDAGMAAYYADGFGFLSNDTLTEAISRVFLVMLFGVTPVGILVVFLILHLRAKGLIYRKLFRIVWILAAALTAAAAVAMVLLW